MNTESRLNVVKFQLFSIYVKRNDKPNRKTVYLYFAKLHEFWMKAIPLFCYLRDNYNIRLINMLDDVNPSTDVIIPIGVKSQSILYKSNIYQILDDKKQFYRLLREDTYKKYLTDVHLIKSYDDSYKGPNMFSKFFIKPTDGAGSENQIVEEGYVYDIISKYSRGYQIQDVINVRNLFTFSVVPSIIYNNVPFH